MFRIILLIILSGLAGAVGFAQAKKQFTVEKNGQCKKVEFSLKAKTGNCFIRPSQGDELLNVYSNQDLEDYAHSFSNEIIGETCRVKISLDRESQRGVGRKISHHVFGSEEIPAGKFWKVYLAEDTPYILDLDYGLGNANVDLAGLAISKLKINTGSADVNVSYSSDTQNKVDMDTFYIKVDMGSLIARQLNLTRSKFVLADVGFGNMLLDFSDSQTIGMAHQIKGSVGAGNLIIHLPGKEIPVIVRIADSWLCSVRLSQSLKKISDNTFTNEAYNKSTKDALTFDLDVSMGKIIFKDRD